MASLDTNGLLRLLMQDDTGQLAAVQQLVRGRVAAGETLFVPVTVALELEWVLRSRFELGKPAVLQTFTQLLSAVELRFEAAAAVEWALRQYVAATADFADCLHAALAAQAGEHPLWTFDKAAARVDGVRLLA